MNIKLIDDYNLETFHDPGSLFPRYDFCDIGVHVFWHRDEKIIMIIEAARNNKPYRIMKCECDEDDIDMGEPSIVNGILVNAYLSSKHQDDHGHVKWAIAFFGMKEHEILKFRFSNGEVTHINRKFVNWTANANNIMMLEHNRDEYKRLITLIMCGAITYDEVIAAANKAVNPVDITIDDKFFAAFEDATEREKMLIAAFEAYYVYSKMCNEINDWIRDQH